MFALLNMTTHLIENSTESSENSVKLREFCNHQIIEVIYF